MWENSLDDLESLDAYVMPPLGQALIRVIVLTATNFGFYTIVNTIHNQTHDPSFFPPFAVVIGLLHAYLFSSWNIVQFVTATAAFYGFFFHCALLLRPKINDLTITMKILVMIYSLGCFRFFRNEPDFDEFILTFVVMTVKVFCACDELTTKTDEELWNNDEGLPKHCDVIAYVIYTGWINYKDFLSLRARQREKKLEWVKMLGSSGSRAIMYHIISYEFMKKDTLGDFYLNDVVLFIIHAFQYRCKYYYRAQLAELEGIAVGVKRGGWVKHCMFDFAGAEFSVTIVDFLKCFNLPLSSNIRLKYNIEDRKSLMVSLLHIFCLATVTITYDFYYGTLWFWFVVCIVSQKFSSEAIVTGFETCLFGCRGQNCRHRYGRRFVCFQLGRLSFMILNHCRLALVFTHLDSGSWKWSYILIATTIVLDIVIILWVTFRGRPRHPILRPNRRRRRFR